MNFEIVDSEVKSLDAFTVQIDRNTIMSPTERAIGAFWQTVPTDAMKTVSFDEFCDIERLETNGAVFVDSFVDRNAPVTDLFGESSSLHFESFHPFESDRNICVKTVATGLNAQKQIDFRICVNDTVESDTVESENVVPKLSGASEQSNNDAIDFSFLV